MQEDGFVTEDGHRCYQGLRYLEEGHDFTSQCLAKMEAFFGMALFAEIPRPGEFRQVIRKGKLANDQTLKQQVIGGMWVHWIQKGMDPEGWGEPLVEEKRCLAQTRLTGSPQGLRSVAREVPLGSG